MENVTATLPHARPVVTVLSPIEGSTYHGVLEVTGNASGVAPVQEVLVMVEGREWARASGTGTWNITLGPDDLTSGANTILVRAFDGQVWSKVMRVSFPFDASPLVWIDVPAEDSSNSGLLTIEGAALDDLSLETVEVRLDGGAWFAADGLDAWRCDVDTRSMDHGSHSIEARAFDGFTHSVIVSRSFLVDQPPVILSNIPSLVEAIEDHGEG